MMKIMVLIMKQIQNCTWWNIFKLFCASFDDTRWQRIDLQLQQCKKQFLHQRAYLSSLFRNCRRLNRHQGLMPQGTIVDNMLSAPVSTEIDQKSHASEWSSSTGTSLLMYICYVAKCLSTLYIVDSKHDVVRLWYNIAVSN